MITPDQIKVIDSDTRFVIGEMPTRHKNLRYLKDGALVCLFDGLDTALDFIGEKMPTAKKDKASSAKGKDGDFYHFNGFPEAMKVYRHTPEKVVKYEPTEMAIKDANEAGNEVEYDVTGDYIDMGRHMEGIPESFGTMHNGNARNRRVNVILNTNQISYIEDEEIRHRGERVVRLIDALEAGGVRTMLTAIDSNECGHTEVVLKQHDEPLTITDLAVVSHTDWKRRMIFRINEYSKSWSWGYGSAMDMDRNVTPEMIEVDSNNNELNIYIAGSMQGIENIDTKFDKLERLLVWEMSKPIPEVSSIRIDSRGIQFNPNGSRDDETIKREGNDVINNRG